MLIEIDLLADGSWQLGGENADWAALERCLHAADPMLDAVLYGRENSHEEAPAGARDLMYLIAAIGLPLSFRSAAPVGSLTVAGRGPIPLPPLSPVMLEFLETLPVLFRRAEAGQRLAVIAPALSAVSPETLLREFPYAWPLAGLALSGHEVRVYDGLEQAQEADAVLVDSVLLPELGRDWVTRAQAMARGPVHLYVRERQVIEEVVPSRFGAGYHRREPDGEASYANCLLMALAGGVTLAPGRPVPDLREVTRDERELDWVAGLPFDYARLDAFRVIEELQALSNAPAAGDWAFAPLMVTERGESRPRFTFQRKDGGLTVLR